MADLPQLVIVELGGNDALRGLPLATIRSNLDEILSKLKQGGVRVILAGMQAPRNLGADYVAGFDDIYPQLAIKHDVSLYPFFLQGVALNPELNQPDGIHPNAAGVKVVVQNLLPLLLSELQMLSD
jgi:acyl-CoA thioesterase-1